MLVIYAAGPTTNALQKRFIIKKTTKKTFSIDMGSTIDALIGKNSRAWIPDNNSMLKNILQSL